MEDSSIDFILGKFLIRFNNMCQSERKDFLVREKMVHYESGSSVRQYKVTYRVNRMQHGWLIEAVDGGWWVFKRKFPLFKIQRIGDTLYFSGMFTHSVRKFNVEKLPMKLDEYLELCKKQPQDVFVKS